MQEKLKLSTDEAQAGWMAREAERFRVDPDKWGTTYIPVPWAAEPWAQHYQGLHFPHLSQCLTGMIAYTPNHEKGIADLQVPIKPGRYLKKYYPDMRTEELSRWANLCFSSEHELRITKDAKTIEAVYQSSGMLACMSHTRAHYVCVTTMHPTHLYGLSDDLAIGYLQVADPIRRKDVFTARCALWPSKKIFSRLYGNADLLRGVLIREGWKPGLLDGARFPAFKHTGDRIVTKTDTLICPFIDHIKWARLDGSVLILQAAALGATHSVQHGNGICPPIGAAGRRPYGLSDPQEDWLSQLAQEGHPRPEAFPDGTPIRPSEDHRLPDLSVQVRTTGTVEDTALLNLAARNAERLREMWMRNAMLRNPQTGPVIS